MTNWRQQKRGMRAAVHRGLAIPMLLVVDGQSTGVECTARLHRESTDLGEIPMQEVPYSEIEASTPRIVFDITQFITLPKRYDIFSVEEGEAYQIDTCGPARDKYIIAKCTVVTPKLFEQFEADQGVPMPVPGVA